MIKIEFTVIVKLVMLKILKNTTKRIQSDDIKLEEICTIINAPENEEIIEIIPNDWISFIRAQIDKFNDAPLWKIIASNECCLYAKYLRRFFPINQNTGDDNWRNLGKAIIGEEYPQENSDTVASNYQSLKNLGRTTNLGSVPVMENIERKDSELVPLEEIFSALLKLNNQELLAESLYTILCCYRLCHRVYEIPLMIRIVEQLLLTKEYRDLVLDGLFYSQYLLAQEENLCQKKSLNHRFVYNLTDIYTWQHIFHKIAPEHNPLLVNCMPIATNIYQSAPFYLEGHRSLASIDTFRARLDILTHGVLVGLEKFQNIAVVGSALVECVGNNSLLIKNEEIKTYDFENIKISNISELSYDFDEKDIQSIENFKYRSELYYSADGGDIDISISEESYKKFIRETEQIIDIMNKNIISLYGEPFTVKELCVGSGIRYHLMHTKIKRKFEIFRVPKSHIDLVSSFHVACVRMYWDFNNLWMTRGCATALLTGINENFNWFSSNKIPTDIILKYMQRGYTTILNHKELACLEEYIKTFGNHWNYGIWDHKDITGKFKFDHPFFRVDAVPKGLRFGKPIITHGIYLGNIDDNTYKLLAPLSYGDNSLIRYKLKNTGFHVTQPIRF